jgi:hypothetical protein
VVTRDIPSQTVAYGCPAVPVKPVNELTDIRQRVEAGMAPEPHRLRR